MTLSLTDEKKTKFKELSKDILSCTIVTIRKLAKLIGNLTITFPAVTFEPFFVDMQKEKVKIAGPKYHYNKFDKKVDISDEKKKIPWWINNNDNACHQIVTPSLDIQAYNHQEVCGKSEIRN